MLYYSKVIVWLSKLYFFAQALCLRFWQNWAHGVNRQCGRVWLQYVLHWAVLVDLHWHILRYALIMCTNTAFTRFVAVTVWHREIETPCRLKMIVSICNKISQNNKKCKPCIRCRMHSREKLLVVTNCTRSQFCSYKENMILLGFILSGAWHRSTVASSDCSTSSFFPCLSICLDMDSQHTLLCSEKIWQKQSSVGAETTQIGSNKCKCRRRALSDNSWVVCCCSSVKLAIPVTTASHVFKTAVKILPRFCSRICWMSSTKSKVKSERQKLLVWRRCSSQNSSGPGSGSRGLTHMAKVKHLKKTARCSDLLLFTITIAFSLQFFRKQNVLVSFQKPVYCCKCPLFKLCPYWNWQHQPLCSSNICVSWIIKRECFFSYN